MIMHNGDKTKMTSHGQPAMACWATEPRALLARQPARRLSAINKSARRVSANKKAAWQQKVFATCLLLLIATACSSSQHERGYVFSKQSLAYVKEGESTKQDVLRALGSPSSMSNFEVERWHYVSKSTEVTSVLDPEITEQRTVSIEFDADGIVKKVENRSKDDLREVDIVERETESEGNSVSAIEQLLGNFGKFNKQRDASTIGQGAGGLPGGI